ncbi:MAG TPA: histidine kinase [Steroidobacteraceae bacterium]|nr:histidine kinase [Steroidobacteraceae bacterium]
MRLEQRIQWLILAVAVTIWIGVGVLAMAVMPIRNAHASALAWIVLFAAFGAALLASVLIGQRWRKIQMLLIGFETLLVVAMAATNRGSPGPLLTPIALQAALLFGTRPALAWVIVQSILLRLGLWGQTADLVSWFYFWSVDVSGELIAVAAVHALRREAERTLALGRINAELRATQALFAESAAQAERMRISRELHDAWGHDLTALSLQLEYASHVSPEPGRASAIEARDLAKSLLAKVRDVVGTLRCYEGHDIKPVLEALAMGAPQLAVHLDIPDTLAVQSAETAQTLMRSAQEIITNTLRHAGARNLWLALRTEDSGVRLESRDDGEGADQLRLGHGLKGLRERFQQQGGQIAFQSARGGGFRVVGWIPTRPSLP